MSNALAKVSRLESEIRRLTAERDAAIRDLNAERTQRSEESAPGLPDLELGQIAFGNPWGDHASPLWVNALVREILRTIERVFWNKNQRPWDTEEDPDIPGIEFRPYYWGGDATEAAKPNLKHGSIEVRWYKHPMRSPSLNVEAQAAVIIPWFESAIDTIRASEIRL